MNNYQPTIDLAGEVCFCPNFWQTKTRINHLIKTYVRPEILSDRFEDLPQQFINPQPRQWDKINLQEIDPEQIIGIELDLFTAILRGALDTEAPIRDYAQTSRKYLEPIHPAMAKFVGGTVDRDGNILELGLWEKEERQHTPALIKIYQQLTKIKITPRCRQVKTYQAIASPYEDLYHHGLHRVVTEYSAVCLYLWMMAHTTGTTQQILAELLQDEVNHTTKFWGMGIWLYPDANSKLISLVLSQITSLLQPSKKDSSSTFRRMMSVLHWQSWSTSHKIELVYTFAVVLQRVVHWSRSLTPEYLKPLCGSPQFLGNNNLDSQFTIL